MLRKVPELLNAPATTPERAWWLGVLLGDGNVRCDPKHGDYRVSVCGSFSTVQRWLALLGSDLKPQEFKRSPGTYQGYMNGKVLVEHLRDTYGLGGPKAHTLPWIQMPDDYVQHFVRGLWDSDGSLFINKRRHRGNLGNDCPCASFGVATETFVEHLRTLLEDRLGVARVKTTPTAGTYKIRYAGKQAMMVADWLYGDAPLHIRNEDRVEVYRQMQELRDTLDDSICVSCGRDAEKQGYCTHCWWAVNHQPQTGEGTVCSCGKSPILAKGMCSACYNRARRRTPVDVVTVV